MLVKIVIVEQGENVFNVTLPVKIFAKKQVKLDSVSGQAVASVLFKSLLALAGKGYFCSALT